MPQILRDPEFWVLVAAVIFVLIAWKPAKRTVVGMLDARSERIRTELEEAQRLREEAQRLLAEFQQRRQDAAAEAEEIVAHARSEAERMAAQAEQDLEASLRRRQQLAEERIAQAEARAVAEIRSAAVDIAIAAARQVIVSELDERRSASLIDAAIADLPQQLH